MFEEDNEKGKVEYDKDKESEYKEDWDDNSS